MFGMMLLSTLAIGAKPASHCELGLAERPTPGVEGTPVRVQAPSGPVVGRHLEDPGVDAFLGVPFGRVVRRFHPAERVTPWTEPLDASHHGPACPQTDQGKYESDRSRQVEDCLTLAVWTPAPDDDLRPVVVFLHGGGWITGAPLDPFYQGDRLAAAEDVVVVAPSYRLGALGWTHLEDVPGSGNLGLLDQDLALAWVRENIAAFGGDPEAITLMGQSAGAMAALVHATHADEDGVRGVIATSGGANAARSPEYAGAVTAALREHAGTDDLAGLPVCELLDAQRAVQAGAAESGLVFGPVRDGVVVEGPPLLDLASGDQDVAMLLGYTRDEITWFTHSVGALGVVPTRTALSFLPSLGRGLADHRKELLQGMRRLDVGNQRARTEAVLTDANFRMPVIRVAEARAPEHPVWMLRYDVPVHGLGGDLGATHGADVGAFLGHPEGWTELYGDAGIPEAAIVAMQGLVGSFARSRVPGLPGIELPRYEPDGRHTLIIGDDIQVVADPNGEQRALWEPVPFDGTRLGAAPEDL